ncbi:MAG: phosphoribosylamine--glycine ligase [Anaerolineae bacterium]|nr:phosphoribosylamine--glycine ligase [Anaerolineae bacterium]
MAQKTVLVVGSGGREHTLAWALARSPQVKQVYVAPGNAGTTWPANPSATGLQPRAAAENVPIEVGDLPALVAFARRKEIDLTVVGPEAALAAGIVDIFHASGLAIFGPTHEAAQLEAFKAFAKDFMRQRHIPTGDYAIFDNYQAARDYLQQVEYQVVVKANGLAAGKGVLICDTIAEAQAALHKVMVERAFGKSGDKVVIEERLNGPEISILAWSDGYTIVPLIPARDHKRVFDNDQGPNTGGMGTYAPAPDITPQFIETVCQTILQPTVTGMAERGCPYMGVLYAGLMLTDDGPKVLEFNCRYGDPETQAVLPLLETDLFEISQACIEGRLDQVEVRWRPGACATLVMASPGYPGSYPRNLPIRGLDWAAALENTVVFHAGTVQTSDGVVTSGGRVLAVSAVGDNLTTALNRAYAGIARIDFEGAHFRRDIGLNHRQ